MPPALPASSVTYPKSSASADLVPMRHRFSWPYWIYRGRTVCQIKKRKTASFSYASMRPPRPCAWEFLPEFPASGISWRVFGSFQLGLRFSSINRAAPSFPCRVEIYFPDHLPSSLYAELFGYFPHPQLGAGNSPNRIAFLWPIRIGLRTSPFSPGIFLTGPIIRNAHLVCLTTPIGIPNLKGWRILFYRLSRPPPFS